MSHRALPRPRACGAIIAPVIVVVLTLAACVRVSEPAFAAVTGRAGGSTTTPSSSGGSLESAASKAGETGRKVAMSLLALGLAIAAIVLAFKRDFREAAGVFAVGIVAVMLATPAGLNLLQDTVGSLFGR
jgi:hypothetical protein